MGNPESRPSVLEFILAFSPVPVAGERAAKKFVRWNRFRENYASASEEVIAGMDKRYFRACRAAAYGVMLPMDAVLGYTLYKAIKLAAWF